MRPSPVIKLALEGQGPQGMSSMNIVDPNQYENEIVNELRRRAIQMARDDRKASGEDDVEPDIQSPDSYKVILKYKDVDGEECLIFNRDDVNEMTQQYAKFANIKVYAQVIRKSDVMTSVDETRDQVEDITASTPDAAWALKDNAKNDNDEDIRDLVVETSPSLTDNTIRPLRSLRFLRTKSTRIPGDDKTRMDSDANTKTKGRKKFAFRIPRKMRPKKGPFQLATFLDPKKSPKNKDTAASDKTSDDNTSSTNKIHDSTDEPAVKGSSTQPHAPITTSPAAPTAAAAKGAAANTLQPVLFIDKNGKAVTKVVQDIKNEAFSFLQQHTLVAQDEKEKAGISLLQCAAPGRKLMSYNNDGDRDSLCITPPLLGLCQDCGSIPWGFPDPTTCFRQSDLPALPPVDSVDSTSNKSLVGVAALRDVQAEMMSMDLAEMASMFGAGWSTDAENVDVGRTINDAKNVDVRLTLNGETRRSRSAPARYSSSGSGGSLFDGEQDMQKALQRFFLLSNDLFATHTSMLFPHKSGLSTVEELDEESIASIDASRNGRSAFQNYANTDDEHASETKIPRSPSSSSNHGNKNPYNNSAYSISQSIGEVLFSNWPMPETLSVINEIDDIDQPEIDRDEYNDGHDDDGRDHDASSHNHPPSNSVTDALLSHLSMFPLGGAKKADKKERKTAATQATTSSLSNHGLSYQNKLRQPARQLESEDILCSPSQTDPTMPTALGRKMSITHAVSSADSKDGSTTSVVDQLDKHDTSNNNTIGATADEDIQYAARLTSSLLSKTNEFSELFSALSTFSFHDSKMKSGSECHENGVSEWSQESYAGFLLATFSGPLSTVTTSPNNDITNRDEIQLTSSSASDRFRSTVKEKIDVREDTRSLSSTLKKNRSSSCRSTSKTVDELLSLSDDTTHHSTLVKKVQSKSYTEGKHGQHTQSCSAIDSQSLDADVIFSTMSTATGKSKQETSASTSAASLGHQPVPNTEAVSARSIENAESFADFHLSSLFGPLSSTKPNNTSLDDDDDDDDDEDMEDFNFDNDEDVSDADTLPFSLTEFLDDISAAVSGSLSSFSSGYEKETAEENNDKEEENTTEVQKQQQPLQFPSLSTCKDENNNTPATTTTLVLSSSEPSDDNESSKEQDYQEIVS